MLELTVIKIEKFCHCFMVGISGTVPKVPTFPDQSKATSGGSSMRTGKQINREQGAKKQGRLFRDDDSRPSGLAKQESTLERTCTTSGEPKKPVYLEYTKADLKAHLSFECRTLIPKYFYFSAFSRRW